MEPFVFSTTQHLVCKTGAIHDISELYSFQHGDKVLLITDAQLEMLGLHLPIIDSLVNVGVTVDVFNGVKADPSEQVVFDALALAERHSTNIIIGFGGGSSMDVAKLVAFLAHPNCQQSLASIYGVGIAQGERLPLIQVPTTAGTGSEVTQVAIVTTGETTKAGVVTPLFLPDLAILDAQLTTGLPPKVTAETGIDAMVHAIEAFTCITKKNPMSDMLAREALHRMGQAIRLVVHDGSNLEARENMLLGAMMAGQAFANSPVAAVHALAYPLGGHFHIPHGLSNSLVLPHVMRFNQQACAEQYAELAPIIFPDVSFTGSDQEISEQLIREIEKLISELNLPSTLKEMDISADFLPTLAKDAMLQTRLLVNNPREVNLEEALAIYQSAYE